VRKPVQRAFSCPCGNFKVLALGLCATCYTLRRQDEQYFGGLREDVLERDDHTCRGCGKRGGRKRSIGVHHRRPGISTLRWMVSLCPGCHAKVHRTRVLRRRMSPFLLKLWREQHPGAPEQNLLPFPEAA
jgi:5-methylcytosine-specific restriction endonuclease McrA